MTRLRTVGSVTLVGSGPGDPELITLKALAHLRQAEVVVYDRLVGRALLREAKRTATLINVGKAPGRAPFQQCDIENLLIQKAREGRRVVRLKGGDPSIFGRSGEELDACRRAGIPCRVIPGVTSAVAAAAELEIPLTRRGIADRVTILTGHHAGESDPPPVPTPDSAGTLVLLMAVRSIGRLVPQLLRAGWAPGTPVRVIERSTLPAARAVSSELCHLTELVGRLHLESPATIVVGEVARSVGRHFPTPSQPLRVVNEEASHGR